VISEAAQLPVGVPRRRTKVAVRGLGKTFARKKDALEVLKGIDLSVEEGELLCVVGPSGCGKSTLLNIIGGFEAAT